MRHQLAALVCGLGALLAPATLGHPGHDDAITRGASHGHEIDPARFVTSRDTPALPLPHEDDAFTFAIFGDRTGGPADGVTVLAQAVRDVNQLEPDLVMTVGDLVEGYTRSAPWLEQMREFKGIMDRLLCPWFPVAGNHDIYWRGEGRPADEHESEFETHFGPLWYAFRHKDCWFIILYSDEANPETGERNFNKPECQVMSPAQYAWLEDTLDRAADARHVFVFLHHPRWLGGHYGADWVRVHRLLAAAGNVRAVFAGHIHRMRHDGVVDGIEYVTLATTGGWQDGTVPEAGFLHHFHLVTVRHNQIALAAVPVGGVMDVRAITGRVSEETTRLAGAPPLVQPRVFLDASGDAAATIEVVYGNPVTRPVEVTMSPTSADSHWRWTPDHVHRVLAPGTTATFRFDIRRDDDRLDDAVRPLEIEYLAEYLAESARFALPAARIEVDLTADVTIPPPATIDMAASFDGRDDVLEIASDLVPLPDGPLTLECWFNARRFGDRTGLVAKTESSEYGFFVSGGVPSFSIMLGARYAEARADHPMLETGRWYHLAGVYDGSETRLYLDGVRIATVVQSGPRRTNTRPLLVGADVDGRGRATSHFDGLIDAVRVSSVARYVGDRFVPMRRPDSDESTALLLNMDAISGLWVADGSGRGAHATRRGGVTIVPRETP
ncbi:MAG: metallophosphoesterase [Phycisphaerales bacterium]|nr:metallophosphoesterase [Phycisphaerales bacterium]